MTSEGNRTRNRKRRMRKKELKRIKPKWDIPIQWVIIIILTPFIIYKMYSNGKETIELYNNGVETTALVTSDIPSNHGTFVKHYEFYVNNENYIGLTIHGNIGDWISIKYLPEDPSINDSIEDMENNILLLAYKKIKRIP